MKLTMKIIITLVAILFFSCGKKQDEPQMKAENEKLNPALQERIDLYATVEIGADISYLSANQKKIIEILTEAGKLADDIFWRQTAPDAIAIRDSLKALNTTEAEQALEFAMINYGPYDRIENKRFIGKGPEKRPDGGTYYPLDMTKEEFEKYVADNPEQKDELESQYTVVVRDNGKLKAIPFHEAYPEIMKVADLLDEAAKYADNPSFKNYLTKRAIALRTDEYFESDMAWMDVKDNDVDVIIGPIENYEDAIFNYKTAWECVIMVKDHEASKELELFNNHVKDFEDKLPYDKKYIRKKVGTGTQINLVNVLYFGGDFQKGTKTIACSLPNDPKVRDAKGGGKNSMFKNMMEAKFDKIVVPIANKILESEQAKYVDKKSFMSFVTLHEVSHTLGRGFVFGNDKLSVRKALQEKYSAIEECKADILGIYNQKHLFELGVYNANDIKKSIMTYLPGLFRSVRFGADEAHGIANLIQLNFLREVGAITKNSNGKFSINEEIFFEKLADLAKIILTIEAEGDYKKACAVIEKYGRVTGEIKETIKSLVGIPRDLNTKYSQLLQHKEKEVEDATTEAVLLLQGNKK